MIKISKREFNQDMDKYLEDRRRGNKERGVRNIMSNIKKPNMDEWNVFAMFKGKTEEKPYKNYPEPKEENTYKEEREIEEINEQEEELEERRESLLKRMFNKMRFKKRTKPQEENYEENHYEEDNREEEIEDVKEVIKITHKWLEQLPPETIERFKRSEDFQKYKEALKTLGMVK